MKKIVNKILNLFGLQLIKNQNNSKTQYSTELTLYKTITGNYFLPKFAYSDVVVQAIINNRIFDKEIVNLAKKFIKKDSIVLDIGSNFGQMAMLFSEFVGNEGKVYAFEADDFIYDVLSKNIKENNKSNIESIYGAVHDESDEYLYFPLQDFKKFASYGSHGIDYKGKKGRKIKTISIDSFNFDKAISFMKIDIQGGDLYALKGAKQTILNHKMPIVFEYEYLFEEDLDLNFQEYVDFVNEIDYKFVKVINGQNYLILPK